MSLPLRRISPSVAVSNPIITLAKVDLPQPDLPTIATVWASRASKSSCSLALTVRALVPLISPSASCRELVVLLQLVDLEHHRTQRRRLGRLAVGLAASQSISRYRRQRAPWPVAGVDLLHGDVTCLQIDWSK